MRMRSASYSSTACAAPFAAQAMATSPLKKPLTTTRVPKFLRCLYDILHMEDQSILTWSKDGTHFQIFHTKRLEVEVLPKYFKHSKFASFQRQLNNFGFRKWTKTQSNVCTFSHHHYVRRHPQQLVELVVLLNDSTAHDTSDATGEKLKVSAHHTGKRSRCESEGGKAARKVMKREPMGYTSQRPGMLPLVKVDPSTFDFEVESWSVMADVSPLEWAAKSHLARIKTESGNETPTSAAGFGDMAFDFTLEELDDILQTSSSTPEQQPVGQPVDARLLNEYYGVEPSLAWSEGSEFFGKTELELYMQDTELWAGGH